MPEGEIVAMTADDVTMHLPGTSRYGHAIGSGADDVAAEAADIIMANNTRRDVAKLRFRKTSLRKNDTALGYLSL